MNVLMNYYFDLEKEINNFYENIYDLESEEFDIDKSIKKKIINLIIDAKKYNDMDVMKKSIKLIIENTGCVEDVEILNSLLKGQDDIKKDILANSPVARWLE